MTAGGEWATAISGCLVGGALVLGSANESWADGDASRGEGFPVEEISLTGYNLARPAAGLALLALASIAAIVATRARVRETVGALLVLTGGTIMLVAAQARASAQEAVRAVIGSATDLEITLQPWSWLAAAGGLMIAAAGLLTVVRSDRWPSMSRRYEAPGAQTTAPTDRAGADGSSEAMWRAQDRGQDPTAD